MDVEIPVGGCFEKGRVREIEEQELSFFVRNCEDG